METLMRLGRTGLLAVVLGGLLAVYGGWTVWEDVQALRTDLRFLRQARLENTQRLIQQQQQAAQASQAAQQRQRPEPAAAPAPPATPPTAPPPTP